MIALLAKWLIPDHENTSDAVVRRAYGQLCGVVGIALNTLALGYCGPNKLRRSLLLTCSLILIYSLFVPSIGGAINEIVAISSAVVGLIRYRKGEAETGTGE